MRTVTLKDGSKLVIRRAVAADAEQMAAFKTAIGRESDFLSYGEAEIEITPETEKRGILATEILENTVMLLALLEEEIVGFVTFHSAARPRKKHGGELGIAVRQPYWGLGIGNLLMAALISWAKDAKTVRKINLVTRADNAAAIRLYEKYGFVREGLLSRDVRINGKFYDGLLMGLPIDAED